MLKTLEELQGQEDKKSKAGQTGRLPKGDGKAKVLTQEDFFEMVQAAHEAHDAAKEASSKKKKAKERYNEAKEVWKVKNADRLERNNGIRESWKEEIRRWETERDTAKFEKRKPGWTKPKLPPTEKAIPKPKVSDFVDESEEEDNGEGAADGDDREDDDVEPDISDDGNNCG